MSTVLTGYQIHVGARNGTPNGDFTSGQSGTLRKILNNYKFAGYTIVYGVGFWTPDGTAEFWENTKIITLFIGESKDGKKLDSFIQQILANFQPLAVGKVRLGPVAIVLPPPV